MTTDPMPAAYLVQHIQDALAADGRARELGVDVTVAGTGWCSPAR